MKLNLHQKNKYTHKRDTKRVMNLNEAYVPYVLTSVNTVGNISFGFRKVTNWINSSHWECSLEEKEEKRKNASE